MEADILILGAGISGLRCGIELLHKRPSAQVVILEKYKYKGGRVVTYKKNLDELPCTNVQWENGAGRVHSSHKKVMELIKRYKLTTFPLSPEQTFLENGEIKENSFETLLELFLPLFDPSHLGTHTLRSLFQKVLGNHTEEFLLQFPYRAEVDTLRADLAIRSFQEEMGSYKGYIGVKEGLSSIIQGMVDEFVSLGGHIFTEQTAVDILKEKDRYFVKTATPSGPVLWSSKQVICALHSEALKKLPCFYSWSTLKHLQMEPLVRVYAVFPVENKRSWFSDIGRTVCKGPIRYFIPINPACGVVMMSYTDGKDARLIEKIYQKGEKVLERFLMRELRKEFSHVSIPDPIFFKVHPWYQGCTYWLPGKYDPEELSRKSIQPFPETMPGVYCCGESFSLRQAWMEGALEQTDLLLGSL